MQKMFSRSAFLATAVAALLLTGCATEDEVHKAQSTADTALSTAQSAQQTASSAQQAAQAAQQSADQANSAVNALGQEVHSRHKGQRG